MFAALTSSATSGVIRTALQFFITVVLAAYNHAADYGLYAFVVPFTILASIIFDAGFGPLVVRPKSISDRTVSTLFTVALVVGVASVGALWLLSLAVGSIFEDTRIPIVLRAMSVVPLLGIASSVPRALLERELRYDIIGTIEVTALAIASGVALGVAFSGGGVWSLVALSVTQAVARCLAFNISRKVKPTRSIEKLSALFHHGKWITLQNLQVYLNRNLDNVLIGAAFGGASLGLYALAYQVIIVPLQAVAWPFGSVLLSHLRRLNTNEQRVEALSGVLALTLWIVAPSLAVGAAVSPELVRLFLSRSWQDLPELMQILCVSSAFQVTGSFYGTILVHLGALRRNFAIGLVNTACLVIVFTVSVIFLNLLDLVIVYTIYSIILSVFLLTQTYRALGDNVLKSGRMLVPPAVTSIAIAVSSYSAGLMTSELGDTYRLAAKACSIVVVLSVALYAQRRHIFRLIESLRGRAYENGVARSSA